MAFWYARLLVAPSGAQIAGAVNRGRVHEMGLNVSSSSARRKSHYSYCSMGDLGALWGSGLIACKPLGANDSWCAVTAGKFSGLLGVSLICYTSDYGKEGIRGGSASPGIHREATG